MVWITQWLCPHRHCSIAIVWDDAKNTREDIEESGEKIYNSGQLNRRCGLCSKDLTSEHRKSIFNTLEEAEPYLRAFQMNQLVSRAMLLN